VHEYKLNGDDINMLQVVATVISGVLVLLTVQSITAAFLNTVFKLVMGTLAAAILIPLTISAIIIIRDG
jgi:hypothetical protein